MEITHTPVKDRFKNRVAIVTGGSSGIGRAGQYAIPDVTEYFTVDFLVSRI